MAMSRLFETGERSSCLLKGRRLPKPGREARSKTRTLFSFAALRRVDERRRDADEEVSIGDFVLDRRRASCVLVIADVVARWVPGVVGNPDSVLSDSHAGSSDEAIKYPQYTRPREFQGKEVPEVLLSGDHGAIARWRAEQSRQRTSRKRGARS